MKLAMAVFVCTTALAVVACERPAQDTTRDQPAADVGLPPGEPAEPGIAERRDAMTERPLPEFVHEAAMANMAEIELGQLAQKRAQNPEVRKFAQRMVQDHTQAQNELKKIASAANVQLPGELDQEHQQRRQRLEGLKGPEFDREYMNMMVEAHQETVDLLEPRAEQHERVGTTGEERPGEEPMVRDEQPGEQQVNQWAQRKLQTVQQHLEQARQLQGRVEEPQTGAQRPQ